jgi:hypothetical protein
MIRRRIPISSNQLNRPTDKLGGERPRSATARAKKKVRTHGHPLPPPSTTTTTTTTTTTPSIAFYRVFGRFSAKAVQMQKSFWEKQSMSKTSYKKLRRQRVFKAIPKQFFCRVFLAFLSKVS